MLSRVAAPRSSGATRSVAPSEARKRRASERRYVGSCNELASRHSADACDTAALLFAKSIFTARCFRPDDPPHFVESCCVSLLMVLLLAAKTESEQLGDVVPRLSPIALARMHVRRGMRIAPDAENDARSCLTSVVAPRRRRGFAGL